MPDTHNIGGTTPQFSSTNGPLSYDPFNALIANVPPDVQSIALRLREIVRETIPGAREIVLTGGIRTALYREKLEICAIQPTGESCSFQLMRGAEIADEDGLLHGEGRNLREMTFRSLEEIPEDAIRRMLGAARSLNDL